MTSRTATGASWSLANAAPVMDPPLSDATADRILILAPTGSEAEAVARVLTESGLVPFCCADLAALCRTAEAGAGAMLIGEEALGEASGLMALIARQPAWSDLPVIVIAAPEIQPDPGIAALRRLEPFGNVMLLERPVRAATLVTALRLALRGRRRQFQLRDHLRAREQAAAELRRLNETLEQRVLERTEALERTHRQLLAEASDRRHIEDALRQAQKMEAVGQLTGGIAHDFNNLLTAVMGNLDFIASRHPDVATRRLVDAATRAAERAARLTQQLLAFARKQHLRPQPTNINDAVRGLSELLSRSLGPTIKVEYRLAEMLWPALVDPNQIELVILNLALNARDAMPRGGRLVIESANAPAADADRPTDLPDEDFVRVSVIDEGDGMAPEILAKAFEPFFTTKPVGKGSGLGLSQVYGVAKQSGGGVRLSSRPGEGTRADVYLQRTAADARSRPAAARPVPPGGDATILVVDDDEDVRAFVGACLRDLGYRVIEAGDGAQALGILRASDPIDGLLIDVAMPDMSGAEVAAAARAARPHLSALFMTGYADARLLDERFGSAPVLHKPFKPAELAEMIRAALEPAGSTGAP